MWKRKRNEKLLTLFFLISKKTGTRKRDEKNFLKRKLSSLLHASLKTIVKTETETLIIKKWR